MGLPFLRPACRPTQILQSGKLLFWAAGRVKYSQPGLDNEVSISYDIKMNQVRYGITGKTGRT